MRNIRKWTVEKWKKEADRIHSNKYNYNNTSFKRVVEKVVIECPVHGAFIQTAYSHILGQGCAKCGSISSSKKKRLTEEEFMQKAIQMHGSKYDYLKTNYINNKTKIVIGCSIHGDFLQSPNNHLAGYGCPICGREKASKNRKKSTSSWVEESKKVHGEVYDYSISKYTGCESPVEIICRKHGIFTQISREHLAGCGCQKCGVESRAIKKTLCISEWVEKAKKVHGEYDYSETVYVGAEEKLKIKCHIHGDFIQSASNHLAGNGCPSCSNRKSKPEAEIAKYLSTFTTVVSRDRTLIAPKELDIYLPDHKIAVEYCGMYWHSAFNKEDERKMRRKHFEKYEACKKIGIRLITIYETDWQNNKPQMLRLLRNAIGKSKGRLMARKCEVRKVETSEAKVFYDKYHPQGGAGGGIHFGLFHKNKMVACMRFTYGANDRGSNKNRQWTLGRYATRVNVSGAASKLFSAFLEKYLPKTVKSFSDNRFFSGGMYESLGFVLEEDVAPDYQVWSHKIGLRPKPHYQRRNLPARQAEHGFSPDFDVKKDKRTEAEVTYELGCGRIYDCGKKRWIYHAKQLTNGKK